MATTANFYHHSWMRQNLGENCLNSSFPAFPITYKRQATTTRKIQAGIQNFRTNTAHTALQKLTRFE